MIELNDLIKFENENTSLDFKAKQYLKPSFEDLIKDILSMANANVLGDRHIIVGVKHYPSGRRKYFSIDESEFMDSATYHQLIRENVEPEIHFDYVPHQFDGHRLGIFRIYDCDNQPYMMRKTFGGLKKGDAYIRKGTHQPPLIREDLDRIWERQKNEFTAPIRIGFDSSGTPKEITVAATAKLTLPSDRAAEKIRAILAKRAKSPTEEMLRLTVLPARLFGASVPYENRSSEELRENLEHVKEAYRSDDLHELYEVNAARVNLVIVNEGETYVEDASITIKIQKVDGLRVANRIHALPQRAGLFEVGSIPISSVFAMNYPKVSNHMQYIEVRHSIGNLRHGIPTRAFEEPLRIVLEDTLIGQKVYLHCSLFGKQLRAPRTETLTIEITGPTPAYTPQE